MMSFARLMRMPAKRAARGLEPMKLACLPNRSRWRTTIATQGAEEPEDLRIRDLPEGVVDVPAEEPGRESSTRCCRRSGAPRCRGRARSVPSVTTRDGSANRMQSAALTRPATRPVASAMTTATPNGTPCVTIEPSIAAARPTVEPTERSISPITITIVIVSAIRPISTEFVRMNEKFILPRK